MISVLSGGTGTPKLLQGIKRIVRPEDLTVIVNTLENDYFSGVYVSADIDTVMYTLCDLINEDCWYGRFDDTFITHETLKELGLEETLRIGDKDRALKIQKTQLLKEHSLEESVRIQCKSLQIKSKVIPMSNIQPKVTIDTDCGLLSFHDFLIKHKSRPEVYDVLYDKVDASVDAQRLYDESFEETLPAQVIPHSPRGSGNKTCGRQWTDISTDGTRSDIFFASLYSYSWKRPVDGPQVLISSITGSLTASILEPKTVGPPACKRS